MDTKKIAIIVQRYGEEICGGGEYYAKQLAEHLVPYYDVDVLTTTSLEYMSWDDYYKTGTEVINGVNVLRFKPEHERNWDEFDKISQKEFTKVTHNEPTDLVDDNYWVDTQGPYCPTLINYLKKHSVDYDVVFVITYIYYTAVKTIPLVKDKCVFLPTAHNEVPIHLSIFKDIFKMPRYFAFLTEEERNFVHSYFNNNYIPNDVVGFGVTVPADTDSNKFKRKFHISGKYLVYVGRIDISKSCDEMISYFIRYKKQHNNDLKLVLIGEKIIDVPKRDDIIVTGFVSEDDKFNGIMGSEAMICPSKYESLCIALLEGMACGKPVLANKKCPVLAEQCSKSNAGFAYANESDFFKYIDELLNNNDEYDKMKRNAIQFINTYYNWSLVSTKFRNIIEYVSGHKAYYDRNVLSIGRLEQNIIHIKHENEMIDPAFREGNIAVCMISSDEYAPICGVALESLLRHTSKEWNYDIVILCSDISGYNMQLMFSLLQDRPNISLRFVNVAELVHNYEFKIASYYNDFTYYRLFIPYIFKKYRKVLYLDSDVIVNHDIAELYHTDVEGYFLAASRELTVLCWQLQNKSDNMRQYLDRLGFDKIGEYIQGGVALYNVNQFNKELPVQKLIEASTKKAYLMADQDIINIFCKGHIRILSNKWNVVNMELRDENMLELYQRFLPDKYFNEYIEARESPFIIHYSGQRLPCFMGQVDLYHYFWENARKTPFYEYLNYNYLIKKIDSISTQLLNSKQVIHTTASNPIEPLVTNGYLKKAIGFVLPVGTRRRQFIKKIAVKFLK